MSKNSRVCVRNQGMESEKPIPDGGAQSAVPTAAVIPVKLVRLREGVYGCGGAVEPSQVGHLKRLVHVVAQESDLNGEVVACCGAPFAPGTLETVQWGDLWPHSSCVRRSSVHRSVLEEAFSAAELALPADDSLMEQSFQITEIIMNSRPDWITEEHSEDWTYTTSFNGTLDGDRRFPRLVDIGLECLVAALVRPQVFRIYSCGVRDGCPKHGSHTESFSLHDVGLIKKRLSVHETLASSIDLQALAWCLIFGECSKRKLQFAVI